MTTSMNAPALHECELRPADRSHLELLFAWRNQPRMREAALDDHEIRWDEHLAWWASVERSPHRRVLVFHQRGAPHGRVQLDVDEHQRHAQWGFQIGAPDAPAGSGTRMGALALDHVFDELALARMTAYVVARNDRSVRHHERLGFVREGTLRAHVVRGDQRLDVHVYGLLAPEWRAHREAITRNFFGRS